MHRIMLSVNKPDVDKIKPLLARDGLTISSFFRKCVADYLEAKVMQDEVLSLNLDVLEGRR